VFCSGLGELQQHASWLAFSASTDTCLLSVLKEHKSILSRRDRIFPDSLGANHNVTTLTSECKLAAPQ
jgi:hypothetical protein